MTITPEKRAVITRNEEILKRHFLKTPARHCKDPEFIRRIEAMSVPFVPDEWVSLRVWTVLQKNVSPWLADRLDEILIATFKFAGVEEKEAFAICRREAEAQSGKKINLTFKEAAGG